jgi:hypothetical protein
MRTGSATATITTGTADVEDEILPLDPAAVAEAPPKSVICRPLASHTADESDSFRFRDLLRFREGRRQDDRGTEPAHEIAA